MSSSAALAGAPRDLTSPALRTVNLKFHTVPGDRLSRLTRQDLVSAGVPETTLGTWHERVFSLTPCIELSGSARASLPPALGGSATSFSASPATADMVDLVSAQSPSSPCLARSLFADQAPAPRSPPSAQERRAGLAEAVQAFTAAADADAAAAAAAVAEGAARATLAVATARRSARLARADAGAAGPSVGPAMAAAAGVPALAPTVGATLLAPDAPGGASATAASAEPPVGPATDDDGLAAAQAALERASMASREAFAGAHEAQLRADASEAALSGPLATSLSGRPPDDPAREQQNIVASNASLGIASEAISYLTAHSRKFPLIAAALRACSAGAAAAPAVLQDFSVLVLLPALHAAKQQEHGLKLLHDAAYREATGAAGARAASILAADGLFDVEASEAIERGDVRVLPSPLDRCLGVLPVAQLALFLFYGLHSYRAPAESNLIDLARRVTFVNNVGTLDPAGIDPLRTAWAHARGTGLEIPHKEIMYHVIEALSRDAEAPGSARTAMLIAGVPTSWTQYAVSVTLAWQDNLRGLGAARRAPTPDDLAVLLRGIADFARARHNTMHVDGSLYPPTPGYTCRNIRMEPVAASAVASAPPPLPPRRGWGRGGTRPSTRSVPSPRPARAAPGPRASAPSAPPAHTRL